MVINTLYALNSIATLEKATKNPPPETFSVQRAKDFGFNDKRLLQDLVSIIRTSGYCRLMLCQSTFVPFNT